MYMCVHLCLCTHVLFLPYQAGVNVSGVNKKLESPSSEKRRPRSRIFSIQSSSLSAAGLKLNLFLSIIMSGTLLNILYELTNLITTITSQYFWEVTYN